MTMRAVRCAPYSWIARWTLLDFFIVLITSIALSKIHGLRWGAVGLVGLVALWHEPGAPSYIWLNLIATLPNVEYEVLLKDGEVQLCENPALLPEAKFIEEIRFKNAEIPIYLYGETRTARGYRLQ